MDMEEVDVERVSEEATDIMEFVLMEDQFDTGACLEAVRANVARVRVRTKTWAEIVACREIE